ncbi:MAG TPA: enoyl-CoA hydratase [Acidimicrobiaceae bacterium]|nr:enoyl-CoA hydratase [Acidimicrobiaceae bacterium]
MQFTSLEIDHGVATLILRDPDRRNALNLAMCAEMVEAVAEVEAREDVSALIVTGSGKAFCAGADLSQLGASQAEGLREIYSGFLAVASCRLPTIAAVNGAAVGAGMNLALACDVRVGTPNSRFDCRFLDLGIHPGGGHTWMLNRILGPQRAASMLLFGQILDGEQAAAAGLLLECVEEHALLPRCAELGSRAASAPRELLLRTKQTLQSTATMATHAEAVTAELGPQVESIQRPEFVERLAALAAKVSSRG